MKKVLIYSTKMNLSGWEKKRYQTKEKKCKDIQVRFPMNMVIENHINDNDDVKVIILRNINNQGDDIEISELCKEEVVEALKDKKCKIDFINIPCPFDSSTENIQKCYLALMESLEEKADIYCDITYGPKYLPFVLFAALNYSEKYFDSEVKAIYYGQVDFDKNTNKIVPGSEKLFNQLSIYALNSFANTVNIDKDAFKFTVRELFN